MKQLLVTLLFIGVTSSCLGQKKESPSRLPTYELYSWKGSGGNWEFSILQSTNRMKTAAEIFDERRTIHGLNNLKKEMLHLVRPSRIAWIKDLVYEGAPVTGTERLGPPPKEIVYEIVEFASKHGVEVLEP